MPVIEISTDTAAPQSAVQDATAARPDWSSWRQSLAERRRTRLPPATIGSKKHPLLWGVEGSLAEVASDSLDVITRLARAETAAASSRLLKDLWSTRGGFAAANSPPEALALVAWARNLAGLAESAGEQEWWDAVNRLADLSREAQAMPRHCLSGQLLAVELSLILAHWLREHSSAADAHQAASLLEKSLLAEIDDDGLVPELPRQHWLPLLACWTRCRMLAQCAGITLRADAGDRYQDFVESLLRLAGGKGSLAWPGEEHAGRPELDLWRAAAMFVDPRIRRAMHAIWPGAIIQAPATPRRTTAAAMPPSSGRSERAGLAVLRPTWSSPRLTIDYTGSQFRLRLDRNDDISFDGACALSIALDGRQLQPLSGWEEICWITDDDVDYLELQLDLDDDVRVQRHILFAREDEFIFLADAVLGQRPANIEYESLLPLHPGVFAEAAAETRELTLIKANRRRAVVLPLALGEWRTDRSRSEFTAEHGGLRLTQSAHQATNMFAPCFIDVSAKRLRRPVTWRRLTVAEERQTQADDAAVGYRVQVGRQQWLFYRSLTACGNRTLLGHNLVSEFLAARFSRKGVAETLIEIEAPADEDE